MENLLLGRALIRDSLLERIRDKSARIGIIGLGYVGLPLAVAFARSGFRTVGFEIDERKVRAVNEGRSYVGDVPDAQIREQLAAGTFHADMDAAHLSQCDCIMVCVPTPLSKTNDPDLSFIRHAVSAICHTLRREQLIVFESTTYPGCTDELVLTQLQRTGLALDKDFLLAFSPERVDPGNAQFRTENIPRVVGGCSELSRDVAVALYEQVIERVYPVSSARIAETAKLLENIFRAVNIGLVNEFALMCAQMNIDVWEVIEAAKTKPYGFMPFYPGPGVGGHCIPLDPAYLSWCGRQFNLESRFINVAERINAEMPAHVVHLVADALNDEGKALKDARILILGVAYKKDVPDLRESPAIEIIQGLRAKKAQVAFHDPLISEIDFDVAQEHLRRQMMYFGAERRGSLHVPYETTGTRVRRLGDPLRNAPLTEAALKRCDCAVIVTDHRAVDYAKVVEHARLIVDTRNAITPELRARAAGRVVRL